MGMCVSTGQLRQGGTDIRGADDVADGVQIGGGEQSARVH